MPNGRDRIPGSIIKDEALNVAEKVKGRTGRPSSFNDVIKEKILDLAQKGKTIQEIAKIIGVGERTLYAWQGKHKDFMRALKEAKQVADGIVEASLFARAVGYSHPELKVFCHNGKIITCEVMKHYAPDVTAQIFWLKNRQPELWRERHELSVSKEKEIKVEISKDDEKL
jgi:transposase-like protein